MKLDLNDPHTCANMVVDACGSTNDLARALGEAGFPHCTWVSARVQENGRGRLGRQWQSLDGNLFLSMLARVEPKSLWSWIPLASSVVVAMCLREILPGVRVKIKWPNDLWIDGAKLGGVLCEGVGTRDGSFVVVGLGLNCLHAPRVDQKTTSLSLACGREVHADDVRAGVIESLKKTYSELSPVSVREVALNYEKLSVLPIGTSIEWGVGVLGSGRGNDIGGVTGTGSVIGLGESGELLVKADSGATLGLFAEDVRVRVV